MRRKSFYTVVILIFLCIFAFHYYINYKEAIKPPSEVWAKEVLISKGDINQCPDLTGYNNNYIIAHQDGNNIKVVSVDKLGKILKEINFKPDGKEQPDIV